MKYIFLLLTFIALLSVVPRASKEYKSHELSGGHFALLKQPAKFVDLILKIAGN